MVFLLSLILNMNSAMAMSLDSDGCTEWKERKGYSCSFFGEDASWWDRSCGGAPNECVGNDGEGFDAPCLNEKVCYHSNPKSFGENLCSKWTRAKGSSCGIDGRPHKWHRACTWAVIPFTACTKRLNDRPTEHDVIE